MASKKSSLDKKTQRSSSFTRRAFILGGIQCGILGLLGTRLAWLQVVEGNKYTTLAEKNRINVKMIAPSRGEITDRFGVPLAVNKPDFRVLVLPEQTDDIKASLDKLKKFIDITDRQIEKALNKAKKTARFIPVEIKGNLSREDVAFIEVNLPELPGILTEIGEQRNYPFAEATAHLVGYVGAVNKKEQDAEEDNPMLSLPGVRIGKSGIEKAFEKELRGEPGSAQMEVNVLGREVRKLAQQDSRAGNRLKLTIDAELQRFAQQRLSLERSATATIMDIHDGSIYAMASFPSFDPNNFVNGISIEQYEELLANPAYPLNNKAITGQYPPGSTFKMITALAALDAGVVTQHTTAYCPGFFNLGKDRFHCWKHGGHGTVNVFSALAQSCDVYFYKLALDLGIDRLAAMARRFGLGSKLGFVLEEEKPGLMPDQNWKRGALDDVWHKGETINASIGQGYTLTTPLQLTVMTARLANGGKAVLPRLTETPYAPFADMNLNPEHLKLVTTGMEQVMSRDHRGTAASSQIKEEGFEIAGKTGTAQVRRITRAQRAAGVKNEDLPWQDRHHALFVGYGPLVNPKYACCVIVEHGVGGSTAAAPIGRDLLLETQKRKIGMESA